MGKGASIKKWKTLCKKDIVDFFKNPTLVVMMLLPIMFVFLYGFMKFSPEELGGEAQQANFRVQFLLRIGSLFNCAMCGLMICSTSVAEEKEKLTLRTLMLSNVGGMEFLLSKVSVGLLITVLGNVIIFIVAGAGMGEFPTYLAATTLGAVTVNLISAVLGLLSRDQMSCGVIQVPVMLLFMLPSAIGGFLAGGAGAVMEAVARVTPLNAMTRLYEAWMSPGSENPGYHLAVLLGWVVLAAAMFVLVYRKKRLDN